MTSRAESKARTRERLLDAAERLFLERGYAATPIEQVAQEAGVTKPAIYRHFASKEELFLALRARNSRVADMSSLDDASMPYADALAEVGRRVAGMTADTDPRVLALNLEFRALSLRREEARERLGDEVRAFVAAAAAADGAAIPPLRTGVSEAEVLVLGQVLLDGLREYRLLVPDLVTEETFATAFSLLAALCREAPGVAGRDPVDVPAPKPPRRRKGAP